MKTWYLSIFLFLTMLSCASLKKRDENGKGEKPSSANSSKSGTPKKDPDPQNAIISNTNVLVPPVDAKNARSADPSVNPAMAIDDDGSTGKGMADLDQPFQEIEITPGSSHNFLLFGDAGTGDEGQLLVAKAMSAYCSMHICQWAVTLGDNIYEVGAQTPDDAQFNDKFEIPYQDFQFRFYSTLGNHDVVSGAKGRQAQIDYTKKSKKWYLPSQYYTSKVGDIEFFSIDSNTFRKDTTQQAWLEKKLKESTSKWKFVIGHHPVFSVGKHGNLTSAERVASITTISNLRPILLPTLCKYADAYFAGHDHHMQIDLASCGLVHVVSGAGAKVDLVYPHLQEDTKDSLKFAKGNELGFSYVNVSGDKASIKMINHKTEELGEFSFSRRSQLEHSDFQIEKVKAQIPKVSVETIKDFFN